MTKQLYTKDIFSQGGYTRHFYPEEKRNPFWKLYERKKQDALNILNFSSESLCLLDVGGGMGRLSFALAQSSRHRIFLTDISLDMLKIASRKTAGLKNVRVIEGDAQLLPYSDSIFDCVVGLDLLCHLENPGKALREFHRVLRDRGMLILDSTNSNPLWAFFYPRYMGKNPLNWVRIVKYHGVYPGWQDVVTHYPKKAFVSMLNSAGFEIEKSIDYGPRVCPKWHLLVSRKTRRMN